jgi:hypothetical protein
VFFGLGATSGNGISRLLIDYPEPERSQILDYLFKPGFGADLQLVKLEIGGDAEGNDAAEPSFEHSKGRVNCRAGYELWLAQQAKARDPHVRFYALQWNAPGWVGHQSENAWTRTDIGYLLDWLKCATKAGIRISYLGGWNEHLPHGRITPQILQWFVDLRAALNSHRYRYIKIVAVDSPRREPDIADYLAGHPEVRRAISILGYHDVCQFPTTGRVCQVPPAARTSGKPIWATEIGALRPPGGAAALARAINLAYIQARVSAVIEFPMATAMPAGLPEEDRGLIIAAQPWSGHYQVSPITWVIAQTTQVTQPGWLHVPGGSGQFGGSYGTFASYMGPRRTAWSLVAQTTQAPAAQTITVHLAGGLRASVVHVRATNLRSGQSVSWFARRADIRVRGGAFTATLRPGFIYSFTNVDSTGKARMPTLPAASPMPLPPAGFMAPDPSLEPWGLEPADGAFEYPSPGSTYFVQTAAGRPDFWQPPGRREIARFPYAVFGDFCMGDLPVTRKSAVPGYCLGRPADYTISADVTFTSASQRAGLIARYYRPVTTPIQYFQGYRFIVSASGHWQIVRDNLTTGPTLVTSGTLGTMPVVGTPLPLTVTVTGSTLTASAAGTLVATVTRLRYRNGVAGICTAGWYPVRFSHLQVTG